MSGNQLERYQRSRKIGEGSFGKVYLALDKETNQPVALKVLTKVSFIIEINEYINK